MVKGCKIPLDKFDPRGDCTFGWRIGKKSGPPGYLKDYIPPYGWIGIGLKVINLFDNGNNDWIGTSNKYGEWYIGYHGTQCMYSVCGIVKQGFKRGYGQAYKYSPNLNPLTNRIYPLCGVGIYFTPDINEAKKYTKIIYYNGCKYRVVFMCRINPYKVRISLTNNNEYWIVNEDNLNNYFVSKQTDEVRPYRILIFEEF